MRKTFKGWKNKTKVSSGNANSGENSQALPNVLTCNPDSEDAQPSASSSSNSIDTTGSFHNNAENYGGKVIQAQQVYIDTPTFNEIRGNQIVYNIGTSNPLSRLAEHAMLDATHDSSDRDPPPRCHPGTRQNILQSIQGRLDDPQQVAKLLQWLWGPAGVGKSAIMQTIAEAAAESNALGASLFFSRPNHRDDPRKIFNTIAYQLAVSNHSYHQYLIQRIAMDPAIVNKTMQKQFNDFFIVPFARQQLLNGQHSLVILLDGLDECRGSREQCEIIKLISGFVSKYPTVPLRWIIASRPEEHLIDAFFQIRTVLHSYCELEIPINSDDSVRDVEHYLNEEFARIRKAYHRLLPADVRWPSEKHCLAVSSAASGLFVFASTVIRFIDDDENPIYRLNLVIAILEKHVSRQHMQSNPFALLDALYERILSEFSPDTLTPAKLILGQLLIARLIHGPVNESSPFSICNMLGLEQHTLYGALRKLRSVLSFPGPEYADSVNILFLHASFSDYLRVNKRSHAYSVNLDQAATYLWHRCMTILQQWTVTHSNNSVAFSWSIQDFKKSRQGYTEVNDGICRWAGVYWPSLLLKLFEQPQDLDFYLLVSREDVIAQLKQVDFSCDEVLFGTFTCDFIEYLERIPNNLSKDIMQNVDITSLDKKCFLKSLCKRQWLWSAVLYQNLWEWNEEDLEEIEELLRNHCEETRAVLELVESTSTSEVRVTILGEQPAKCRVLLRDHEGKPLYFFPYIA